MARSMSTGKAAVSARRPRGASAWGGSEAASTMPIFAAWRAVPFLALADVAAGRDRSEIGELGPVLDDDVMADDRGGADIGVLADLDAAEDELVADDSRVGDGDAADRGARSDRQRDRARRTWPRRYKQPSPTFAPIMRR